MAHVVRRVNSANPAHALGIEDKAVGGGGRLNCPRRSAFRSPQLRNEEANEETWEMPPALRLCLCRGVRKLLSCRA